MHYSYCSTVELPLDIHNDSAIYETQFGYVQRPTHKNTTWDAAKFEVCGLKVSLASLNVPDLHSFNIFFHE